MRPRLEVLETRDLLSVSATFAGRVLNLVGDGGAAAHNVLIRPSPAAGFIDVIADGQLDTYSAPQQINYTAKNGANVFVNRTAIGGLLSFGNGDNVITTAAPSTITAKNGANIIQALAGGSTITVGNGANNIYGGPGDQITAGNGGNIIYDILPGNQTVRVGQGGATSYLFVGPQTTLTGNQPQDRVARFFAPGRAIGSGTLVLDTRTLYFTADNGGDSFTVTPVGNQLQVSYRLADGVSRVVTFASADVDLIAAFGGAGNDRFTNLSDKPDVLYGAAGQNALVGGFGPLNLLKAGGAAGNSTAVGNSPSTVDLTGSGVPGVSTTLQAANPNVQTVIFRSNSPADTLLGRGARQTTLVTLYPDLFGPF